MTVHFSPLSPSIETDLNQPLSTSQDHHSSPNSAASLKAVLASITAESCPRVYNFHMHTLHSDGKLHPEALIAQALSIGLRGLAITDHHSVDGFLCANEWLAQHPQREALTLWSGVEVNARLLNSDVHILCYAFDPTHHALKPYIQGRAAAGKDYAAGHVIKAIHKAGGVAVLAHPNRYKQPATDLIPEAARQGIDGVETYYAYDNPKPWRPSPRQTQLTAKLADEYQLLSTCGTDSHGLNLLRRL